MSLLIYQKKKQASNGQKWFRIEYFIYDIFTTSASKTKLTETQWKQKKKGKNTPKTQYNEKWFPCLDAK